MFDGALQCAHQLAAGTEHSQVEVVVIVCDDYLTVRTNANADRIIGHTLATNDSQWSAIIREYLQTKTTSARYQLDCAIIIHLY